MLRRSTLIIAGLMLFAPAARADQPFVQVRVPVGLSSGFVTTAPAPNGNLYVTIDSVRAVNPSAYNYGTYDVRDFHLVAGDRTYYPVTRPGLAAIDLSSGGTVRPKGSLLTTVTFQVPPTVTIADFEFVPHWFDDNGASVAFCCYYQ
jgi:acetamidase/formamidase